MYGVTKPDLTGRPLGPKRVSQGIGLDKKEDLDHLKDCSLVADVKLPP